MRHATSAEEIAAMIPDGSRLMIGGFMGVGTPERIVDALVARGAKNMTVIANDTALPGKGIGKMIDAGCISKVIASHIGLNPITQQKMIAGEIEVELVPQGTLIERIRAAGAGLGGVLTRTGVGTVVAEGKQVLELNGRRYLLEMPIEADYALVFAHEADHNFNLTYRLTAANFNPIIALAAKEVIVEAGEIVPVGVLPPDAIRTPGVVVDFLMERRHG